MGNIAEWTVENMHFWESKGKTIAYRNLWISIPCLLLSFAIWMMWSIIIVQMENLGFVFDPDPGRNVLLLYTLPSIAGLAGATLRIPHSFLVAIGGGRNVVFLSTVLLLLPTVGAGLALQDPNTSYLTFAILAALSGFGGGNFASSMSNISFFFPKRMQGTSLGLNAGLGNLGVSVMQLILPLGMTVGFFTSMTGQGRIVKSSGAVAYIQNCGWTWVPLLLLALTASWFSMDNLKHATPKLRGNWAAIGRSFYLIFLGLMATTAGLLLLLVVKASIWIVLPVTIVLTLILMRLASFGEVKESLKRQFSIFSSKHNWVMTVIYTMTFGSFIGYSAAFPKLIQDVFGTLPNGSPNPNAPNPFVYAWLGPLVGSLVRPIGGWLSDRIGSGSRVTQWITFAMIAAALALTFFVTQARTSEAPERFFLPFLMLFLVLFVAAGIGNGSTFRSIPYIFPPEKAGPVLGWTSAVAAYGSFIIPQVFGQQIQRGHAEYALYGFAIYYVLCLLLNWWHYERKDAEVKC
ncbi:MAG: NarK/NasA family nitrate transporter [Acidobacteria bacterium]|nr:NarK/NasA family nitrate transporter [Acidobacteriota bacterium]